MKIAIASEGDKITDQVSEKGGRAPYYLIFENQDLIEIIKNPFAVGGGGAGFSVAYLLAEKEVNKVYAGQVGENMKKALKEKGIDYELINGQTVEEIIGEK